MLLIPGFEGATCLARVRHLTVGAGQLVHATFSVFWVVLWDAGDVLGIFIWAYLGVTLFCRHCLLKYMFVLHLATLVRRFVFVFICILLIILHDKGSVIGKYTLYLINKIMILIRMST